jgi:hypothetical protein
VTIIILDQRTSAAVTPQLDPCGAPWELAGVTYAGHEVYVCEEGYHLCLMGHRGAGHQCITEACKWAVPHSDQPAQFVPYGTRETLREMARGEGCPAGVSMLLDRIATGHVIMGHEIHYVTRTHDESKNFYARLRAAGMDVPGGSGLPFTAEPEQYPRRLVDFYTVRTDLRLAARGLARAIDHAARLVSEADRAYGTALGF